MKKPTPAVAGALLTSVALLVGVAAMYTVADEPEQPAQSEQAEAQAQPKQPATTEAAAAPQTPDGVEAVLRILATGRAVPAELQDPAFDYYVDLTLLGAAWVDLDPSLTADLALQFLEGERVLRRSHRVIKGADIMKIAVRLAILKNDNESLARLEKAIEESGNEQFAADLAASKADLAEAQADSVWTVPVATTSALDFALYKGVLQDIEAAIIVQDRATLKELEGELEKMAVLPQAQRARLQERVKNALAKIPEKEPAVSAAATILDKLAHASRRFPSGATPYSGGHDTTLPSLPTVCTAVPTECNQVPTECVQVSTTCPEGGSETQCPATFTQCPPTASQCPQGSCQTQQPSAPTECQAVVTECPAYATTCSPEQCPTQQPSAPTECQAVPTQCPAYSTVCNPNQCQTQQPSTPTQCLTAPTVCPPHASYCPPGCEQPTQRPSAPTQCSSTQTKSCGKPTMTPQVPTQCSSAQTKSCGKPTLFPQVPTRCPSMMTSCPPSATYCPPTCGQQQQKQRWTPPPGKNKAGGFYQQGYSDQELPSSPYRRRDAIDFGN